MRDCALAVTVQFEGSLGRLTASSIRNPRQIIDLHASNPSDADEVHKWELRRFKQTMFNIEKVPPPFLLDSG